MTIKDLFGDLTNDEVKDLAAHSNQEHILSLVADSFDDKDVLKALTHNIYTPEDVLLDVAGKSMYLSSEVAKRRDISLTALASLYNKDAYFTVVSLASNPNTPPDILDMIAYEYEDQYQVLTRLASNPSTPQHIIRKLYVEGKNGDNSVSGFFFAGNPNCPRDVLVGVHNYVSENGTDNYLAETLVRLAGNPSTPKEILREYATSDSEMVRYALARNLFTPDDVRTQLMSDSSELVSNQARKFAR